MENISAVKYFDDKIIQSDSGQNVLPVFHSCDAINLKFILEAKKLLPTECSVFTGEHLLYLFYGRPAYKKRDSHTNRLNSYLPISFIIDWGQIAQAKRVAPFDTGAFKRGMYKKFMHPKMKVDQFFMRPERHAVTKTTSFFYGRNAAYYDGKPKKNITFDPLDFEIESYHYLINNRGEEEADDRKTTIEIQLDKEILLTESSLKAVILPSNFEKAKIVKEVITDELKAQIISYDSYGVPSSDNYTHILALTKGFLVKNKYFLPK